MSEQGDRARKALHDMRWGPHIDDIVERQEVMDDAIKVALGAVAALEADNAALREKNEHLFDVFKRAENRYVELQQENAALRKRVEGLEETMQKIVQWSEAYPLDVFPEPDFKKAAKGLKNAGMTLDAISASNMRHVVEGVGKMAKSALAIKEDS